LVSASGDPFHDKREHLEVRWPREAIFATENVVEDEALSCTLPESNSKNSENGWLEDGFPFGMAYLQGFLGFCC